MSDEKNDDDMTTDERLAWLKERGVLVETAEDRKRAQVAATVQRQAEAIDVVTYVLVPADTSKPLQELSFQPQADKYGDQLLEHLKPAFVKKNNEKNVDITLLKEHATQTLTAGSTNNNNNDNDNILPVISDETLHNIAIEGNVECFTLVHPIPSNNFIGINIYLDEVGMLKRLPLNRRASEYAERAGFNPPPIFYGDIFIGRIQQKPIIKNTPFFLGLDTSYDAPWLKAAITENLTYQMEMNQITGRKDPQQPAIAGSDGNVKQEDGFTWTQTEQELEVVIVLATDATSKDVNVKFKPRRLDVTVQKETKLSLQIFEQIYIDGCTWTIEKGKVDEERKLVITMEKVEEAFWPRIKD